MVGGLQPNPDWRSPSRHARALAQGAWAGAGAVVLLTFAGLAGDVGSATAIFVTAVLPGLAIPLGVGDILVTRRASDARLSLGLAAGFLLAATWFLIGFVLPSGLPLPEAPNDAYEAALPTMAGLLVGAERLAARGHLAWRDRALGAAAGYAVVGGVFLVGVEWLSWAVLLALLPLRLPRAARVSFAVLSGAAALGLGQYLDTLWMARAVEATAFALYAATSLLLGRLRPMSPVATAASA